MKKIIIYSFILLTINLIFYPISTLAQDPCDPVCCPDGPQHTFEGQSGLLPAFGTLTNGGWESLAGTPEYFDDGCNSPLTSISLNGSSFSSSAGHAVFTQSGVAGPEIIFQEGKTYCIQLCMRLNTDIEPGLLELFAEGQSIASTPTFNYSDGWQTVEIIWTSNNNYYDFSIQNITPAPIDIPTTILIDDICISEYSENDELCMADFSYESYECGVVCFSNVSCGEISSFVWTFFGPGLPTSGTTSNDNNPCFSFPMNGTYQVDLTVFCSDGTSKNKKELIDIINLPIESPSIICPSDTTIIGFGIGDECEVTYIVPNISYTGGIINCTLDGNLVNAGDNVVLSQGIHTMVCIVSGECNQIIECVYSINIECEEEGFDCPIDVLFIMDNSGSINYTSYMSMAASAIAEIGAVNGLYSNSKFGVAHYSGVCGDKIAIEHDFIGMSGISAINRQFHFSYLPPFNTIMDDLNEALDAVINGLNNTADPDILTGTLNRTPGADLYVVIYTDGSGGGTSLAPSGCTNSALKPYTNSNILKNSMNANISVVHFIPSPVNDMVCAAIASNGGNYYGPVDSNPGDPGNALLPRQYIPSSFGNPNVNLLTVIPPCNPVSEFNCDSLTVQESVTNEDSCCYSIDIHNGIGNDIVKLEAEVISPDWKFNTTSTNPGSGFKWYPGSTPTSQKVSITGNSNVIPNGTSNSALQYCFSPNVPSPSGNQVVVFKWYSQINTDVFKLECTDTIETACFPVINEPCLEVNDLDFNCNPENSYEYLVNINIKNTSGFNASHVTLNALNTGFLFANCTSSTGVPSISIPIPGGLPSGNSTSLCVKIIASSPVLITQQVCFDIGIYSFTNCCHKPEQVCVTLEPCCDPCDISYIKTNIDVDSEQCCFSLGVENNCDYQTIRKIKATILTPGVSFGYHALGAGSSPDWTMCGSSSTMLCIENTLGYIPKGTHPDLLDICFDDIDNPSESPQKILLEYIGINSFNQDTVFCSDTLVSECEYADNKCLEVTNQSLVCDPDSNCYRYTFDITNKSTIPFGATDVDVFIISPSDLAFVPSGGTFPVWPLYQNNTKTISSCIKSTTSTFPTTATEIIFGYRLRYLMGDTCCYESVLDTIAIPPCTDCCDEDSLDQQLDDFLGTIQIDNCTVCFDPSELDSCIGLSIKWGDGSGDFYPLDSQICKTYNNLGIYTICAQFEVYPEVGDFPCFLKEKCIDVEIIECDTSSCCDSEDDFQQLIAQGFQVKYLDDCTVEVCANQFDTCHWFWSLGPDWGDGSVQLPTITRSNPPYNCWTHTYTSSGNYKISINVEEASNGEHCWEALMETDIEINCEPEPCFDLLEAIPTDISCDTSSCNIDPWCHQWVRDLAMTKQTNCTGGFVFSIETAMWGSTPVIVLYGSGPPDYDQFTIFDCNGTVLQDCIYNGGGGYTCNPDAGIDLATNLILRTVVWNCGDSIPPLDPNCGNGYMSVNYDITIQNTSSHTIDQICLNALSPTGVMVTPSILNTNLAPSTNNTFNIGVLGSLVPGDVVNIEMILKDTLVNGEKWECRDTFSLVIPGCPCPQVDYICDFVSTSATPISDGVKNCCYEIDLVNEYCEFYFSGIQIELIAPANISQISANPGWIITQLNTLSAKIEPISGFIPMGNLQPFTICNMSNTNYQITISWLIPAGSGMSDEICPTVLNLDHCDNNFSCYEFVTDSVDCDNSTYCFKVKNTSNPGFDLYSVNMYDLTGGLILSPTGIINIPNSPLSSGQTSDWICVTYSGVNPGENVCYKLAVHNSSQGEPPTTCCTDSLENCFVIPDCPNTCSTCPIGSIAGPNLITNGDFSAGYTGGWYSNYNLRLTGLTGANEYSVRNSTNLVNGQWSALDHTINDPLGNFLTINGPSLNVAYGIPVNVKPNTNYVFCMWVDNLVSTSTASDPIIRVDIGGSTVIPGTPLPKNPDGWQLITYNYYSGTTGGLINIEVFDIGNTLHNDWAIDDVTFRECQIEDDTCCDISDSDFNQLLDSVKIVGAFNDCEVCVYYKLDSCTQLTLEFDGGGVYTITDEGIQCQSFTNSTSGIVTATIFRLDENGDTCKVTDKEMPFDLDCISDETCCENDSSELLEYIVEIFDDKTIDSCQLCFHFDVDSCEFYEVDFGDGNSYSGNGNQVHCHDYMAAGNYNITISLFNYDSLGNVCASADSTFNIDIDNCSSTICDPNNITIYNAISPGNGDIMNDKLIIEDYIDCGKIDISIYNRWGQLVWVQKNYDNTWNGVGLEGKPLPDGTYFLILGLPDQNNSTAKIKTFIDLRRDK